MTALQFLLLGLLALLLAIAAIGDMRARIIPNRLNLAIAGVAMLWWIASGYGTAAIGLQIALAFGALILFGLCFALGMMGGGDVKLIVALALILPPGPFLTMLVWMAIGGGVLSLVMLAIHAARRIEGRPEVPYGVAIVAATWACMANQLLTTPHA